MVNHALKASRAEKVEQAFEDALLELARKIPFEKITVTQLVKQAGYARGTFYNRYEDMYDFMNILLSKKLDVFFNRQTAFSKPTIQEQIAEHSRSLIEFFHNNRDFLHIVFSDEVLRTQLMAIYRRGIRQRQEDLLPMKGLPDDLPEKCIPAFREFWHNGVSSLNILLLKCESEEEMEPIQAFMEYIGKKLYHS